MMCVQNKNIIYTNFDPIFGNEEAVFGVEIT